MSSSTTVSPCAGDVLHSEHHSNLSQEEIAKAIARHQREHPSIRTMSAATKPSKTTPRH